ncbi:hypothetical protein OG405_14385 [Nocardia sp. NBC_01329]|nr:hypothetical protein OG405_14385 [Nocardia sp. NBC_01329]
MTTLDVVAKKKAEASAELLAAVELVRIAKKQGMSLTGPDGLLHTRSSRFRVPVRCIQALSADCGTVDDAVFDNEPACSEGYG